MLAQAPGEAWWLASEHVQLQFQIGALVILVHRNVWKQCATCDDTLMM